MKMSKLLCVLMGFAFVVACSSSDENRTAISASSSHPMDEGCNVTGVCPSSGNQCIPNVCTLTSPPNTWACVPTQLAQHAGCDGRAFCATQADCDYDPAGHFTCVAIHQSICGNDPSDRDHINGANCACFPSSLSGSWLPTCCDLADTDGAGNLPPGACTTSSSYNGECKVISLF